MTHQSRVQLGALLALQFVTAVELVLLLAECSWLGGGFSALKMAANGARGHLQQRIALSTIRAPRGPFGWHIPTRCHTNS